MTDQMTPETPAVEEEPMAAAETPVEVHLNAADEAIAEPPVAEAAAETPTEEAATPDATPDATSETAAAEAEPEAAPARGAGRRREATPRGEIAATASNGVAERGLRLRYRNEVIAALTKQFEYANPNQVPRIEKIVVNIGMGEALTNAKAIDAASGDLTAITGQKPIVLKARRSIAQFKIRTGNPIGLKVTLRGQRMWDFLERLTMLALPRIRDFRGIPGRSFDGRGNYTMGLREQIAFPEIDYDKVDRLRGLEVSIVTTAKSDEESKRLLELLGMPFAS
jgi:large subunit ribosomal protein L5